MELKIGEIVELRGVQLQVVEIKDHSCKKCYFYGDMGSCIVFGRVKFGSCFATYRIDKKNINYVRVTNNDKGSKTK